MKYVRSINSFIVRNRKLSQLQQQLYDDGYIKWGLHKDSKWNFPQVFNNKNKVILEIGFGQGDTLIKNAAANPDLNYIGIEVYQAGLLNVIEVMEDSINYNIHNIRVCNGDAKLILAHCISDKSLYGVQIFFPDPWPKRRHHKRRLINTEFMNVLATKIQSGGFIHLATDWADYASQMLQVLSSNNNYMNLAQDKEKDQGYYKNTVETEQRLLTKFEQRGINHGHDIFDLKFRVI